ncbi:hypothetical protein GGR57DRAFT_515055 [Xylariaceae sp. FL1272]|nr:hypothetical protein GGR57DRAFT_515055 [Xylariaceae sp. FL1272]
MSCKCHAQEPSQPAQPPVDYKGMQAVTTIINPSTLGRDLKKVVVFQSLANGTVGYQQLEFDDQQPLSTQEYGKGVNGNYDEQPAPLAPIIKFGSNIVSLIIDDTVHVYGVSAHTGAICLLSPVFQRLGSAEVDQKLPGKIAGCGNGKDKAYIYFQKAIGQGRYAIFEKSLTKLNEKPNEVTGTKESKVGTDIVAFFDGKNRWIAYQVDTEDNGEIVSHIQVQCTSNKNLNHKIEGTETVIDGKLIALAATNAEKNGRKMIYIYFRGQQNKLYYTSSDNLGQTLQFSAPKLLHDLTYLEPRASLSVLPSADGIMIYGIKKGGEALEAFLDPWTQ